MKKVKLVVCSRRTPAGSRPEDICPLCRHTVTVHPGLSNPDLTECAICVLLTLPRSH